MKQYEYKIEKINEHIYRLIGLTNEYSYLVIGNKKAILIDTCCGVDNLRQTVDELTTLPYDVILTHGHVDHVGGVGRFKDKNIYLNRKDFRQAKIQKKKLMIKFYLKMNAKLTENNKKQEKYEITNNHRIKFLELKERQIFDLGNLHLEALSLAGHTQGMMAILIIEDKILLTGDGCNPSTFLFLPGCLSIKLYHQSIKDFIPKVKGQYNEILLSHEPKTCNLNILEEMEHILSEIELGKKNEDQIKMGLFKVKIFYKLEKEMKSTTNIFYK